ncbi:predicted protein [Sclerotinia sclerotiorum 1980 UF-70]|uniref:DDE-1 domain-containing protein n=2 Tax=Sclerotinia sclerotiorum (strain ATCC 18683 / 1980 / Ss-1) TaxID=665079 RepID=A7F8R7_SCLS1|nr:predicted protein [Sclerotinia sclerotiorum 1980 UF-70]APA13880.1 hypothetical protein sscle_11g086500 [Sclerotinia sclerotiorum 1980 UF-70]EDN99138.1 predicted protein [Sclerotinia sclerotiorum 1980 UF-70]
MTDEELEVQKLQYPAAVHVIFNETGYFTRKIATEWLNDVFAQRNIPPGTTPDRPAFPVIDSFPGHLGKNNIFTEALKTNNIIQSIIPGVCTGFLKPADPVHIRRARYGMRNRESKWSKIRDVKHGDVTIDRTWPAHIPSRPNNVSTSRTYSLSSARSSFNSSSHIVSGPSTIQSGAARTAS